MTVAMMDDDMEDEIICELFSTHVHLLWKCLVSASDSIAEAFMPGRGESFSTMLLRPGPFMGVIFLLLIIAIYLQSENNWYRQMILSCHRSLNLDMVSERSFRNLVAATISSENIQYDLQEGIVGVYAIQGRRGNMEDRFSVHQKVDVGGNKEMSFFGIYDGHGGQFAAEYAKENLFPKIIEKVKSLRLAEKVSSCGDRPVSLKADHNSQTLSKESGSSRKASIVGLTKCAENSNVENTAGRDSEEADTLNRVMDLNNVKEKSCNNDKKLSEEVKDNTIEEVDSHITPDAYLAKEDPYTCKTLKKNSCAGIASAPKKENGCKIESDSIYTDSNSNINFTKLLTDQVVSIDSKLVQICKSKMDFSGTTAVLAVLEGELLIIGNVGDSRAVMGDVNGATIPLSFDHKPNQLKESRRIKDAGGFITFNGVWRVAGILATSRALGDFLLKDPLKLITAEPDVLTFSVRDHKAHFVILATDGLWDVVTNEEAVAFIGSHINEKDFGARSLALHAFDKGSQDNITVAVINLTKL